MPRFTRERSTHGIDAAGAGRCRAPATRMARCDGVARWSTPRRRGSPPHGLSRVTQYAMHLAQRPRGRHAVPAVVAERAAAVLGRRAMRARVSGVRAGGRRGDRARARVGAAFAGRDQQPSFRRRRVSIWRPSRKRGWSVSRSAIRRRRCRPPGGRAPAVGTNPIAAVVSAAGAAPLVDRPFAVGGRRAARSWSRRSRARRFHPAGHSIATAGRRPTRAPRSRDDAAFGRREGRDARADHRAAGLRPHRVRHSGSRPIRFFVDEGNRPRIGQAFLVDRSRRAGGPRRLPGTGRDAACRDAEEPGVRLPGARRRMLADAAGAQGIEVPSDLAESIERLASA